jgi:hypothetical protein
LEVEVVVQELKGLEEVEVEVLVQALALALGEA